MPADDQFRLAINDQIYLSPLSPGDIPLLIEYLNEQDIYERTLRVPSPYAAADAEKFLAFAAEATQKHGHPLNFAIRQQGGALIGGLGFDGLANGHRAEIGYWLAKPFWGRGIMTDVVRGACEFAVTTWGLVRVTAHVFESNLASARVLEKCGFVLEGRLRKHHLKDGKFLDSRLYALVR